jgi:murein L,D-transpeptidase YafK
MHRYLPVFSTASGLVATILAAAGFADAAVRPASVQADRIVIEKSAHRLTLYSGTRVLESYAVALGAGGTAPKTEAGDRRTPEGRYRVDGRNPHSAYHLSLHLSYPEARDLRAAAAEGVRPGGNIMIHGLPNGLGAIGSRHRAVDWTAGCIAVTDGEIEEIWRSVPDGTPVEIKP